MTMESTKEEIEVLCKRLEYQPAEKEKALGDMALILAAKGHLIGYDTIEALYNAASPAPSGDWQTIVPKFLADLFGEAVDVRHRRWAAELHTLLGLPSGDGWREIESAPKDGTRVLLVNRRVVCEGWCDRYEPIKGRGDYIELWKPSDALRHPINTFKPTLWQPLPPPPAHNAGQLRYCTDGRICKGDGICIGAGYCP